MLSACLYANTTSSPAVAVVGGPKEAVSAVAFRVANEVAATGRHVLILCRDPRGREAENLPLRADLLSRGGLMVTDTLSWQPGMLQQIDEIHVNSMRELKYTLAMVHTLKHSPDLIVLGCLSELVDPLCATSHGEFEFLNQAMAARFHLDDALRALQTKSCGGRPCALITDTCLASETAYLTILGRDGACTATVSVSTAINREEGKQQRESIDIHIRSGVSPDDSNALGYNNLRTNPTVFKLELRDYFS